MKKLFFIALIAGLHWIACISTQVLELHTMGFLGLFPERGHGLATGIAHVLAFPVLFIFERIGFFSNELMLPFSILNSLIWGTVIYFAVAFAFGQKRSTARN